MTITEPHWGTLRELEWIGNIGRHFHDGRQRELLSERKQLALLKKYIDVLPLRKNWGCIDRKQVVYFAQEELKRREKL